MSTTQLHHAWYQLTRGRSFGSLALVPIEEGTETLVLAQELAVLAARDPAARVLVINATGSPVTRIGQSAQTASLPGREMFNENGIVPVAGGRFGLLDLASKKMDEAVVGLVEVPRFTQQAREKKGPFTLVIVATNAPLTHPASVSSARAAEAVIVCVSLGESTFAAGRRTLELVGEESVVGSLALRP